MKPPPPRFITRIKVDRLFGQYSYDLATPAGIGLPTFYSRLALLYGDNGSGKTTLLRLTFDLLSSSDERGHRTRLATVPFRRFELTLGGDVVVGVFREEKLTGHYTYYVKRPRRPEVSAVVRIEKDGSAKASREMTRILKMLQALGITLFYVTDERDLLSDSIPKAPARGQDEYVFVTEGQRIIHQRIPKTSRGLPRINSALRNAIDHAVSWAQQQVLSGSQQGEADANTLYTQIVRRLTSAGDSAQDAATAADVAAVTRILEAQATRSADFARFGLPSAANITELTEALLNTTQNHSAIVAVVKPYAEGVKARLDAMQEVQQSISAFIDTLNAFLVNKSVSFNLRMGIAVVASNGVPLEPESLSSGEKQLLLLFCNTLIARPNSTIFLIDEPELSLNIKWQRRLIGALAATAGSRQVQFVLATHSFEVLAPHAENVLALAGANDGNGLAT